MIILGIDPPNAWAVVETNSDTLMAHGHWSKSHKGWKLAERIVGTVTEARAILHAQAMIIEDQFVGWGAREGEDVKRNKASGALVLARNAGRWVQEWERRHGTPDAVMVAPAAWRKVSLPRGTGRTRDAKKAAAMMAARALFGVELQEDEAEAALIARAYGRTA